MTLREFLRELSRVVIGIFVGGLAYVVCAVGSALLIDFLWPNKSDEGIGALIVGLFVFGPIAGIVGFSAILYWPRKLKAETLIQG